MTPEQERENAIRGMKYVASDTARIRRSKRAERDEYIQIVKYCPTCSDVLGEDQPIGAKCWRCADTIALEKKKVMREDETSARIDFFFAGMFVGGAILLIIQRIFG